MYRNVYMVASLLLALVACEQLDLPRLDPPELTTDKVALNGQLPRVTGIFATRANDVSWYLTYRFSHPMQVSATEQQLRLMPVNGIDGVRFALGPGIEPDSEFGFVWNTTGSTVSVRYAAGASPLWRPVVLEGALDLGEQPLDGTATVPVTNPGNLARSADDGFAGPSTHIGLPLYTAGVNNLADHPRYRLHNDHPVLRLEGYAADATLPTFVLGADNSIIKINQAPATLQIQLHDRNWRSPQDDPERRDPLVLAPQSLTAVEITDSRGDPVLFRASWDLEGRLRAGASLTVTRAVLGDLFVGLDAFNNYRPVFAGTVVLDRSFGSEESPFKDWLPVTGGVLFAGEAVTGTGTGLPGVAQLHVSGSSWRQNEWVLFAAMLNGFGYQIVANSSTTLLLSTIPACLPTCQFVIYFDPGRRFSQNQAVQILSDTAVLTIEEAGAHPLPWTIRVRGGAEGLRSYHGLTLYDGIRDGNEPDGPVNNDVVYYLQPVSP